MMSTYSAVATHEEGWWTVEVKKLPGFSTQSRRISQIPQLIKEELSLFPEIESDPADVIIVIEKNFSSAPK